jgi:hypothetical protein
MPHQPKMERIATCTETCSPKPYARTFASDVPEFHDNTQQLLRDAPQIKSNSTMQDRQVAGASTASRVGSITGAPIVGTDVVLCTVLGTERATAALVRMALPIE